jgi:hypothetical protein
MMALLDGHVPGMKELYNAFRFLLACVIIFGSGYLLAKPHNGRDSIRSAVNVSSGNGQPSPESILFREPFLLRGGKV